MKLSLLILLIISPFLHAQTALPTYAELESKIIEIESFEKKQLPLIQNEMQQSLKELETYINPKLISNDKKQIELFVSKMKKLQEETNQYISTSSTKPLMVSLDKVLKERKLFTDATEAVDALEKSHTYPSKLNKYFDLLKSGNYNRAKLNYALMSPEEKTIATDYEKNLIYTIREKNVQEYTQTQIVKITQQVVKSLSYPESSIKKITDSVAAEKAAMAQFTGFKTTIENALQFDYMLPSSWDLGLFSCEEKRLPKYLRLKNFPNLIVLSNEGTYNSVIELSPSNPNQLSVIYHCSKMGSFGSCLENKEKKLCQLSDTCAQSMADMEGSFDRSTFFKSTMNTMPADIITKQKAHFKDPNNVNIFSELNRTNRLGYYTEEEVFQLMDKVIEKTKSLQAPTPEALFKKFQTEITNLENQEKAKLKRKPGYSVSSEKTRDSTLVLTYLMASMTRNLEDIKDNDKIQEFSYSNCSNNDSEKADFCSKYAKFKKEASLFEAVEEVQNFVPEECPRIVFRFQDTLDDNSSSFEGCTPLEPTPLNHFIKDIGDVLKN